MNKNKLNIGKNGKMELTPEMMKAFGISEESLRNGEFATDSDKAYEEVSLSQIPRRTITSEEYSAMPLVCKKGAHRLLSAGYIFTVIACAAMVVFIYTNEAMRANNLLMTYGACVCLLLLVIIVTVTTCIKGLSRRSEIAVGEVILCDATKHSGGKIHYYVTVSLPESGQRVRVECYRSSFVKLVVGSKVYVGKHRAFATEK